MSGFSTVEEEQNCHIILLVLIIWTRCGELDTSNWIYVILPVSIPNLVTVLYWNSTYIRIHNKSKAVRIVFEAFFHFILKKSSTLQFVLQKGNTV